MRVRHVEENELPPIGHRTTTGPGADLLQTGRAGRSATALLGLQRAAGNRAVVSLTSQYGGHCGQIPASGNQRFAAATTPVQRCGSTACDCSDEQREQAELGLVAVPDAAPPVQRFCDPTTQSCPPEESAETAEVSRIDAEMAADLARIDARRPITEDGMRAILARCRPISSVVRPDSTVAFAATAGFVSATGYSVPTGVLASEALAAEGMLAAEGLVAAQGVVAAGSTVVEGATLAEGLIATGEAILVFEAAGAGEVEAVTGPPGWIVGGIILLVAGAAIGAGYLLLREPAQATAPSTTTAPTTVPATRRHPGQTCEDTVLDQLQAEKDRICGQIPGSSCSPAKVSPKRLARMPCSEIRLRIQAMRDCMAARERIQDDCFGGRPDPVHEEAMNYIQNGINHCVALEAINCAPGHPMAGI